MIQYNEKDFFMQSIKAEAKLSTLAVQKAYRIFGLKNENNPALMFRLNRSTMPEDRLSVIARVLKNSNIQADFYRDYDKGLAIGVRRDVREHVLFTSALLQTIIYFIEGRIDLPKNFRLPCDLAFPRNGQYVVPEGVTEPHPTDMDRVYAYYFGSN